MNEKPEFGYYVNRHSCFILTYHLVLVTKFRRPVLVGNVRVSVYSVIMDVPGDSGCVLQEMNGEPDHVHILFDAGPEICIQSLVNVIKTKSSRFARRDNAVFLRKYYWKPFFWTDSYFVATVGSSTRAAVENYIKNQ